MSYYGHHPVSKAEARARLLRSEAIKSGIKRDTELARALNMSKACLSNRMSGKTPWSIGEVVGLVGILHLSDGQIADFVNGKI